MAFTAQQHREYRAKLKEQGICIACHKRPGKDGYATCSICEERTAKRDRGYRKDPLRCHDCKWVMNEFDKGSSRCASCAEAGLQRKAVRRWM